MSRNIWLTGMLALLISCNGEKSTFRVSGTLDKGVGMMIYLKEMTSTEMIPVDSTLIDDAGGFELNGTAPENRFYAVHTQPESFIYLLAGKGDKITIEGDATGIDQYLYGSRFRRFQADPGADRGAEQGAGPDISAEQDLY